MTRLCNRENMQLWIAALRSGQFQQGRGALKVDDHGRVSYCCLGVACQIAKDNGLDVQETVHESSLASLALSKQMKFDGDRLLLPPRVRQWLGVDAGDPFLVGNEYDSDYVTCVTANDNHAWSFEQIADALVARFKLDEDDDDTPAAD